MDPQNINARYHDKFGQGRTNVNISNPPGGKSTISLGWEEPSKPKIQSRENLQQVNYQNQGGNNYYPNPNQNQNQNPGNNNNNNNDNITGIGGRKKVTNNYQDNDIFSNKPGNNQQQPDNFKNYGAPNKSNNQFEPSVKVSNAPGGKSNFQFGYDDTNYNNYKK